MKDRRRAILEAAALVIARRGVRGLRVDELAAEAGVSKALVYYHFEDRAGLLRSTLEFIGARAERYTRGDPADPREPGPPLEELERRLLLELQEVPEVRENSTAWGELRAGAVFDPELREELARARADWVREVADLLGLAVPAAPEARLVTAAERLTALLEGLSTRWLIGVLPVGHARELLRQGIAAEARALLALPDRRAVCTTG
ncbi:MULTISPECIES: TetR/AcrR family transcriptional regulator [Streptomyces]|nr:TetR/AcrR family transcriptional regulator [Streptomyces venezuelae]APE25708.1 TetR family transcriptional regulator [Streptomyces venezuelae]QES03046.1 TetR family transcriptional regulator [Streptomyces venezuelae ATCC 10712]QES10064.1 TetR family transcriptional regulator [Streptomyces venezuelae]